MNIMKLNTTITSSFIYIKETKIFIKHTSICYVNVYHLIYPATQDDAACKMCWTGWGRCPVWSASHSNSVTVSGGELLPRSSQAAGLMAAVTGLQLRSSAAPQFCSSCQLHIAPQ